MSLYFLSQVREKRADFLNMVHRTSKGPLMVMTVLVIFFFYPRLFDIFPGAHVGYEMVNVELAATNLVSTKCE